MYFRLDKRLIVQLVERAAHNGLVVGSNPTGPNFFLKNTIEKS